MGKWVAVDEAAGVFTLDYSVGRYGESRTLVCKIGRGRLLVISPASQVGEEVFAELETRGSVAFIVAPNSFHSLGVEAWHKRWPEARIFAPALAIARLKRKCPAAPRFETIEELQPILPSNVLVFEPPYLKRGETMAWIKGAQGWVWYITDLVCNYSKPPPHPVMKLILWTLIGGGGLRINRFAKWLYVKEKAEFREWFLDSLKTRTPVALIPSHGEPLHGKDVAARLGKAVRAGF